MKIARDAVAAVDVEVWDVHGNLLERSEAPILYLHGGYEGIFPIVEAALEGKGEGDRVEVQLEPEEGFGEYDENLVRLEDRDQFPEELSVGMQFEGVPGEDSDEDDERIYTVTDIAGDSVVLDGNHPYAGIAVKIVCRVVSVREATPDEIEQEHPNDPSAGLLRIAS